MQTTANQIKFLVLTTTIILLLLVFVIVTLLYLHQKKQLSYQRNINKLKLDFERMLLTTQIEVQEQTFQHISTEIHDNINLSLTLVKLYLNTLDWSDKKKMKTSIKSSIEILGASIVDLNNLSKSISTEIIKSLGLIKALKNEISKIERLEKLKIVYEINGEPVYLNIEKELVIFRVIQESLNNILKHSLATQVLLRLTYDSNSLIVLVKDNGVGFQKDEDSKQIGKAGIRNMHSRTKLFGGDFQIYTRPQKGTEVMFKIPYYDQQQN